MESKQYYSLNKGNVMKDTMKLFKKIGLSAALLLAMSQAYAVTPLTVEGNQVLADYVHTEGTKIVDEKGEELFLNGINLGNWLLWEGYLMMGDFNYRTHTQFKNSLTEAFGSETKAAEFEHQWRLNYVDDKAISDLKALGFNSVRVPFMYGMFWENGELSDHGFQYLDALIESCRTHGLYVLLDMHAAPGYQNPGDHSDNVDSNASQPLSTVGFWDGDNIAIASKVWKHIATRYKDESVVWGYDLINEPVLQEGREFELLQSLITMKDAIREVDSNHVIVAEGGWWSSDLTKLDWSDPLVQTATGITEQWDDNLVYQLHHYGTASDTYGREDIALDINVPVILGEYGESDNANLLLLTQWAKDKLSGYYPWSFKKMSHDKTLWTIPPNDAYTELKGYITNGGTANATLYDEMITFAQTNIRNGHESLEWHQGFFEAVSPFTLPPTATPTCDEGDAVTSLPGTLQVEDYCADEGILFETSSDTDGSDNIGWLDAGDWAEYRINVSDAGVYDLVARYASPNSTGQFTVLIDDEHLVDFTLDTTGDWQEWQSTAEQVNLTAGIHSLKINIATGGFNLNWLSVIEDIVSINPCDDTAATALPSKIEAEEFCNARGLLTEVTEDIDGGENIGWIDSGDWAEYNVSVTEQTDFIVNFRVASDETGGRIELLIDGVVVDGIDISSTGGWQEWRSLSLPLGLTAGDHIVRLNFNSGGLNLNWIEFETTAPVDPVDSVAPPTGDLVSGSDYTIESAISGKSLDVADVSTSDGGNIHQWDFHGNANQIWTLNNVSGDVYTLVSKNSDKCLDADSSGTNVHQWSCFENENQKWTIEALSEGGYVVRTFVNDEVMAVDASSTENGGNIVTETETGDSNQQWIFNLVE